MNPPSKPPAKVLESVGAPMSVRFTPAVRDEVEQEARARGLEPAVFVRLLVISALEDLRYASRREASVGMLTEPLRASLGIRRR